MRAARTRTAIAVAVAVAATALPASSAPDLERVGALDRRGGLASIAANGNLIIDHAHRRGYQAVVAEVTTLYEVDLDSLEVTRTMTLPRIRPAQTTSGPTDWLWAIDPEHGRLFAFHAGLVDPTTKLEDNPLLVIDLAHMEVAAPVAMWPRGDRTSIGISYHAPSDRLYLLTRVKVDASGRAVFILESRTPGGELVFERTLTTCFAARDHQYAPTVVRSVLEPDRVYINCYGPRGVEARIVRVILDAGGMPVRDEFFPAVPGPLSTMFDPGSDRMFFLTINGGAGRGVWVFDGRRSAFVGVIASGDARLGASDYSMGVDPTTGRIYLQTPAGFLVADARRTPLPAGLIYRELAGFGTGSIQVDPVRRNLFVPDPASINDEGQAQRYAVIRDRIARSTDPPLDDPDRLTADVAEADGITEVAVSGSARSFGARVLQTGGAQKAAWNAVLGMFAPEDLFDGQVWDALLSVPLAQRDRDLALARVPRVTLTDTSAEAHAISADADVGTRGDLESLGAAWPATVQDCLDDDGKVASSSDVGANVHCDLDGASASGFAAIDLAPPADVPVSIRTISAGAEVRRDPDRGLVASSAALIGDLDLAGRVRMRTLRVDAETTARGRPETANARFSRLATDLWIDVDGDGEPEATCDVCDPAAHAAQINQALAGFARVEFPEPDEAWYPNGSPRGYQAIVRKEAVRGYSERALNDDESPEVVGMQVTLVSDARAGRTRHVIQLAGVQAESHYGVYLLPVAEPPVEVKIPEGPTDEPPLIVAPTPTPTAPAAPEQRTTIKTVAEHVAGGLGVFVADPIAAGKVLILWLVFAAPFALIIRRRRAESR